jgi:CelD/BcsL family acetyltransferase involved in cellulose biosynthesis
MKAARPDPALRVEEVRTLSSFRQLKGDWDDLCTRSNECFPMLSHTWLCAWWQAFGADMEMHVVLVWQGPTLAGAAPLVIKTRKMFLRDRRILGFFSNAWVDRMHFLLSGSQAAVIDAILDYLQSSQIDFDVLDLFPLDDASQQTAMLLSSVRQRRWKVGVDEHLQSPFLVLPGSWEQLMGNLSSSFRQTLRRKVRKIAEMKNVTVKVVRDASCLAAIRTISLESWQNDCGTSMASEARIQDFYTSIIEDAASGGTLRCAIMEVDGEPAAFEFNLLHRNTLHNLKLGFRKKFSELSSGIVLKSHLLKEILDGKADRNLTEYDFMGTTEPYKLSWTKSVRSHSRYYLFADKWNMRCVHWVLFELKPWAKRELPWLVPMALQMKKHLNWK